MADIQKISIAVTAEQLAQMKAAVDSGQYATISEIVRDALRDWQYGRERYLADIARLREMIDEGEASGPAVPFDGDRILDEMIAETGKRKASA